MRITMHGDTRIMAEWKPSLLEDRYEQQGPFKTAAKAAEFAMRRDYIGGGFVIVEEYDNVIGAWLEKDRREAIEFY